MTSPGNDPRPGVGNRRIRGKIVNEQVSWQGFVPLTSTSLILTGITVAAGRALREQEVVTPKLVTAGVVLLLGLTMVNQVDPLFAATFALLILIVTFLEYGPDILTYMGVNLTDGS